MHHIVHRGFHVDIQRISTDDKFEGVFWKLSTHNNRDIQLFCSRAGDFLACRNARFLGQLACTRLPRWYHESFAHVPHNPASRPYFSYSPPGTGTENLPMASYQVVKAPEPDNIIWENLEFSKLKRRIRQNVTGLVSFVLLLIAFGLVLAANGVQGQFAQIIPKIAFCQLEVRRRIAGGTRK